VNLPSKGKVRKPGTKERRLKRETSKTCYSMERAELESEDLTRCEGSKTADAHIRTTVVTPEETA